MDVKLDGVASEDERGRRSSCPVPCIHTLYTTLGPPTPRSKLAQVDFLAFLFPPKLDPRGPFLRHDSNCPTPCGQPSAQPRRQVFDEAGRRHLR